MPLYSTATQTNARGKMENGSDLISDPEVEFFVKVRQVTSWCYLFIHHSKADLVSRTLEKAQYSVFIHKSIVYKRENKRIKRDEQPTISGLVFVQGDGNEIQALLKGIFFNLYLVKDCSSGEIAVIPDSVMQPFMRISEVNPTRIRFMPHIFDYYSSGNTLIRITSGPLAGLEGYRIRISRDKCLVTSIGGMTVAIGGIYKENFENVDEYVRQRREQLRSNEISSFASLTQIQTEIDNGFFNPQNQLDVLAIAKHLDLWVEKVESAIKEKDFDTAVEVALFLLEEVGSRFLFTLQSLDLKEVTRTCQTIARILERILNSTDVSTDLKEIVETGMESLEVRFPFLAIE